MGVWGTYANFFSQWSATYWHAEGKTVWLIENLDMDAILQNGKNCSSEICVAWAYGATARFYNSAGVQVGVITPPADNCYASAYSSNDRAWSRCKRYGVEIASSATTMKLTWTVSVQRRDGIWLQAWSAARTVTLVNT
jgi:hypothetical protein